MTQAIPQLRIDFSQQTPDLVRKLQELSLATGKSGQLEPRLAFLVDIRASQMNGCAFCLDMHVKEAKIHGERELRLHHVAIWRESPQFEAKERAALALTEALTQMSPAGVSDALYAEVREHFSEAQFSTLLFRIAAINAWNRINVACHTPPGTRDKAYGLDKAGLE